MFALDYYSHWLGPFVSQRDRLPKLEVRYDPRDISHVYVRDPETLQFRPVERRDGFRTSLTLWEHRADRACRRGINDQSEIEKVARRRQIAAVLGNSRRSRSELRDVIRSAHAAEAPKLYDIMRPPLSAPLPHPLRKKRRLPVEDW